MSGYTLKKIAKRGLLVFALPFVLYALAAIGLSVLPTFSQPIDCPDRQTIYVGSNGIHLSIILPRTLLPERLPGLGRLPQQAEFVSFGWGDRQFFLQTPTWEDLSFSIALKAIFWPTEAVLHVNGHERTYASWYSLALCPNQVDSLRHYIMDTFQYHGEDNQTVMEYAGYTRTDRFYGAKGQYSLMKTCNNWVNQGLQKAEVPTSLWSPFAFGVRFHLRGMSLPHQGNM